MISRLQVLFLCFFCLFAVSVFAGPLPATCNHPKVRVRTAPTVEGSRITGQLNQGDSLFILDARKAKGDSQPWYKVQAVESPVYGWVYGKFITPASVDASVTQQLAWQVFLDYGNTVEQAVSIFGKPEKVERAILDEGRKEQKLIYLTHTAVYHEGLLVAIFVDNNQTASFGTYRIGTPLSELKELSRRYIVDYDSLIFLNEEHDEFRFNIRDGKVESMSYFRASAD